MDESSKAPNALACPICQRPLKRTSHRLLSAFECEQCGPFSDFYAGSARHGGRGPGRGPGDSGSDEAG